MCSGKALQALSGKGSVKPGRAGRSGGFTLPELLLSMIVGTIVMGGAALLFANLSGVFATRTTDVDGTEFTLAPAYNQLPAAMQMQAEIQDLLAASSTIFVVGGSNESGNGQVASSVPMATPASLNWTTALDVLPIHLNSPTQFRGIINPVGTTPAHPEDFSIYFVSGRTNVMAVIHSRRVDSGDLATYRVDFYTGATPDPDLSYRYAIPASTAAAMSQSPGATHHWLRRDDTWSISEHLGAEVVFPDPTAMPYHSDGTQTHSRFILFIPTKP